MSKLIAFAILLTVSFCTAQVIDQQQEVVEYGYWFELEIIRWQIFRPTFDNINGMDIYIHKSGDPGNVIIEITDSLTDSTLYIQTMPSIEAHSGWIHFDFEQKPLIPERAYYIKVNASIASASPANRYFWECSAAMGIDYYPRGNASIPYERDFAFRTYGCIDGIKEESTINSSNYSLYVAPNPFNSSVSISAPKHAIVEIFDINGRCIAEFDGGDQVWRPGVSVGTGIYLVRAKIGNESVTKRIVYLK